MKSIPPIPLEEIERLLARSAPLIHSHAAIVHTDRDALFSGVYAKSFGCEGILTAGHCTNHLLEASRVALCVADEKHQFFVDARQFEVIPIGHDESEGYTSNGPDLSFLLIRDERILNEIKRHGNQFYDLDANRRRVDEVFRPDMDKFNWSVIGNPGEKVEVQIEPVDGEMHRMSTITTALIQGSLAGYELRNAFDYIKLILLSNFEDFPKSYEGVSGGGIWYQRLVKGDGNNYDVDPILAGISVWQSQQMIKDGYRVRTVTGHGWLSLYGHVRRALFDKSN